jgi:TRAP transporter TAXI family solute receptor
MNLTRRACLGGLGAALGASLLSDKTRAQVKPLPGLPSTMIWSVGDNDGPRFKEAQAIADALTKMHGTRIRLQPAENAFGRMEQLKERQVTHGWLGTEVFFAAEGLYAYVAPGWGPQDLRCIGSRISSMSIVASRASGIKSLADLKGKRYAAVPTAAGTHTKTEAILDAAGITAKDLTVVTFANNAEAFAALLAGTVDFAGAATQSVSARLFDQHPDAVQWIELPATNRDLWGKIQRALPMVAPFSEDQGAAISKDAPKALLGYRDPVITVYADAVDLDVYAVAMAIAENFELYRSATPIMSRWEMPRPAGIPTAVPFHDGAIKYYKEKNVWTADHQRWQDAILKRQGLLRQGWANMMAKEPAAKDADPGKLRELWAQRRADILKSL